jgi:DNA-binding CsgD family transcriptional regulator
MEHPTLESISPREREVLAHLLRGLRVNTIARALHVSPHTVRNHLKAIFQKLGVNSQAELIVKLHGLMSPEN